VGHAKVATSEQHSRHDRGLDMSLNRLCRFDADGQRQRDYCDCDEHSQRCGIPAARNVVRNAVSYREMARRSLGITWLVLSESERQRFSDLFVQVLRDAVASRMNLYVLTNVFYLSEQREGNFAEVRTLFRGEKNDTAVDVRLVNQSGQWLMYDAVIDGVRLVENYRSQFVHVMRDGTYAGLIGRLEAMLLIPKTFERTVTR
jgi:ABC-type transporter MlaC component